MIKRLFILFISILFFAFTSNGQGRNHTWLLGSVNILDTNTTSTKGRLNFTNSSVTIVPETRKMAFYETQANISDENGNLKAASNGCWIMNANGDTMLNGSGINPGLFTDDHNSPTSGLVLPHGCIMLPFPGDSNKIVMFHQTGNYDANLSSTELYYTVIDLTLDNGLGGIISNQKNVIVFSDTLNWGLAACKHANGRDWWIIANKENSSIIIKTLFSSNGIVSVTYQNTNMPNPFPHNSGQPCFSPDGTKFAYKTGYLNPVLEDIRIFSFDRCSGNLDSIGYVYRANQVGFGLSFSPNSKYLYSSTFEKVFQLNTDTTNIAASDTLVAAYDGYFYPYPSSDTNFWIMYLAANGKIYISPSGGVLDYHVINYPDSVGLNCDLQQHSLHLPCYSGYENVNHPNYYLGAVAGSVCDSLGVGLEELKHDFHFSIYPNPSSGNFNIIYLLPQNKNGLLEIFDVNGRKIYSMHLPQWSTLQNISLPATISNGLYNCVITSGTTRVSKKLAVIKAD